MLKHFDATDDDDELGEDANANTDTYWANIDCETSVSIQLKWYPGIKNSFYLVIRFLKYIIHFFFQKATWKNISFIILINFMIYLDCIIT